MVSVIKLDILGLRSDATEDEIKKAYFTKAKLLHPDLNHQKDTTRDFNALLRAYSTLSDPQRRAAYD